MIEAYGVKGMKSKPWQKTFKSVDALNAWAEKNDAEVYATRQDDEEPAAKYERELAAGGGEVRIF